jgi:transcription termination/antitermination protein NusA
MKSEFIVAFNEICEQRGLPKEVVIEALKTALVSAYRRNTNVSNTQEVTAEIDARTGEPTIYAEKEVVDSIIDHRTEVLIDKARRSGHPEAQLGDTVMVESTPENFGRIAAQTAKQVILQRVREAERDQLFEDFSAREGELVNGTVQSVTGAHITIGLGRTEAILPKGQQVNSERYRPHDKIRVYVLEVRRTNRGPQIIVSRNHRNLLRRLLELEVPEIFNGQVEIKSIAREAGARSKIAVMALQPGIDPVGACVGMRGVRIQSIVRELNDEKIDVIEWDSDQRTFIAKALSPARVSHVFLEDHPDEGKTAVVIVPDDQLSLAIGREGQNARLAAKLTTWRIDIKSLTEAAGEALDRLDHPAADPTVVKNKELIEQVKLILAKKEANRPITAEDYSTLNRLVAGVEGRIIAERASSHEQVRKERSAARKRVPEPTWELPLEELNLPTRVHTLLEEAGITNVGEAIYQLELGQEQLLNIEGFGEKALSDLREAVDAFSLPAAEPEAEAVAEEVVAEAAPEAETVEAVAEPEPTPDVAAETVVEEVAVAVSEAEEVDEADVDFEAAIAELPEAESEPTKAAEEPAKKPAKPSIVVVARPAAEGTEDEDDDERRKGHKGKQLVFDENRGKVVVKRKRKAGRRRPDWEEFLGDDLDNY